ncbi:hypothetical protein CYLTODRAFT_452474 [Cylindrobasidium torrendii FP15055 ss-10]|uniref:Uncharacterized protein n=1 Tax=Cylindrobasidium torrendii FP15055 ss-10 TaxID=1314674 RepID=A0A0D7BGB7_9AGAR|nr:hypothetical protein CYLTODRAFT_452474 [Cylindrobasidium torrendii FP15055 ss-10]
MGSLSPEGPSWPSLYNPGLELLNIDHREPEQPGGVYLHEYGEIFAFTFYWSLVFCLPVYFLCSSAAFFNVVFPGRRTAKDGDDWELRPLGGTERPPRRTNERRSRLTFAVIVTFVFLCTSLLAALVGATISSLIMLALFRSGNYHISTWIPFLAAIIQVLIGLMNSWPSVINFI